MYEFYHPRILEFARKEAQNPEALDSDRMEALKYVCTYGDQGTALDLLGRFFHSGNEDLREGVSLICVAFEHPDCDKLLDEMGREPHTAGEYRNAVIGAGVRLADQRADRSGVTACLGVLPCLLRSPDPEARPVLEGMSLLATFAAQEVEKEIQAAWRDMPGRTKLYCLEILLKIRAGLLPDPEFLRSVLSNTEPEGDGAESPGLWKYVTREDVAGLIKIAQDQDVQVRDEALDALAKIRANRADLVVEMPSPEAMPSPEDMPLPEDMPSPGRMPSPEDEGLPLLEAMPVPASEPDADSVAALVPTTALTPAGEDTQEIQGVTEDIPVTPYRVAKHR